MHTNIEVVGAPLGAGLEQGQNFLGVVASEFETVLKNDEKIKEMLKKKAQNGKNWTVTIKTELNKKNINSIEAYIHIKHIFSTDEIIFDYSIKAFNTTDSVIIVKSEGKLVKNFKNSESKTEHLADVVSFNIRVLSLFKNLLRELSVLDWSDGEDRSKVKVKVVLSNLADLVKVRREVHPDLGRW